MCKDVCVHVGQGHEHWSRTCVFMLGKDVCVHVRQGRVHCARSRVFMLGKDVSPEDEAASLSPPSQGPYKVINRWC